MKTAFLDTSGWFAALRSAEDRHRAAADVYRQWSEHRVRLVTTNLVVAEMQTLILRTRGVKTSLEFLDRLHSDPTHEVVYVDRALEHDAVDRWLRRFADQPLSLTDAVSFEVMRSRHIKHALTLDEHFAIAGFSCEPA